jgi:hypothetical protein
MRRRQPSQARQLSTALLGAAALATTPMNDGDFACEPAEGSGRFAATAA